MMGRLILPRPLDDMASASRNDALAQELYPGSTENEAVAVPLSYKGKRNKRAYRTLAPPRQGLLRGMANRQKEEHQPGEIGRSWSCMWAAAANTVSL